MNKKGYRIEKRELEDTLDQMGIVKNCFDLQVKRIDQILEAIDSFYSELGYEIKGLAEEGASVEDQQKLYRMMARIANKAIDQYRNLE